MKRLRHAVFVFFLLAAIVSLTLPSMAGVTPYGGKPAWNQNVCGHTYVPINLGHGNYFNVYNAQNGSTCVSAERHHLSWTVTTKTSQGLWEYPNISSGIEWGKYTCYDGHSAYPGHGSTCMRYPVQEKADGTPLTSVEYWPHLQYGNVAYDIWFNKEKLAPSKTMQNDGTEVMIWLSHPGVNWIGAHTSWYTWIQGHEYAVMNWVMYHNNTHWNFVAYVAVHQTRFLTHTWLNGFFRDAIKHQQLSPDWWLTGIDFGSEMSYGGAGFAVKDYSLEYVK